MHFKKLAAGFVIGVCLIPIAASAQSIQLTLQAKQQLFGLASQLVRILDQIATARGYGQAYLSSGEFVATALGWSHELLLIQQQVSAILAIAGSVPSPTYPTYPSASCPQLYRDLEPGMYGSDIASLQQFLARDTSARYNGPIDSAYSPALLAAVQRFQAAHGIAYYGDWNTTGYGRVGPATRAAIARVCATSVYTPPNPPFPPLPPPGTGYSTGTITMRSHAGQDANTVSITVTAQPNASCSATTFTLLFGDGAQQVLNFSASCSVQTQTIPHTYPSLGNYTATLKSGTFQSGTSVTVAPSNYSISLSAAPGSTSYSVELTATYNPGGRCDEGSYTLEWGDGSEKVITFFDNCSAQTKTYSHTYSGSGAFVIRAQDNAGDGVTSINFESRFVPAAGAGDPNTVLKISGDGSIVDASPGTRSLSVSGATIDAAVAKVGSSINFNGLSYVSAASSADFHFGALPFTVSFWFRPRTFPATNAQAGLLVQANAQATDASLGGAGLELFGNKLAFVGNIGGIVYHPFYNNTLVSSALTANTWYHAALVRNGNTLTLYLNGVQQGAFGISGSSNASTNALTLGRYGEYSSNYFNGWMDEIDVARMARWTANFDPGGTGTTTADCITTTYSQVITLTSGTSWTVPSNWNSHCNTVEVIGGGGGGGAPGGGGGGAYSLASNITLTSGAATMYAIGSGGGASATGGDTYFCTASSNCTSIGGSAVVVGAKGGSGGSGAGGSGGTTGSGVGTTKRTGGAGGSGSGCSGGGGGGAAGSTSDGGNGSAPGGGTGGGGSAGIGGGGGTCLYGGPGSNYGGGGGGAGSYSSSGGAGALGVIVIRYNP